MIVMHSTAVVVVRKAVIERAGFYLVQSLCEIRQKVPERCCVVTKSTASLPTDACGKKISLSPGHSMAYCRVCRRITLTLERAAHLFGLEGPGGRCHKRNLLSVEIIIFESV